MGWSRARWYMPVLVLVMLATPAVATSVSFDSAAGTSQDATIYDAAPNNPIGVSYTSLEVAGTYGVRSVLQFDVSSIAGLYSSINSITLRLNTSYNGGSRIIDIHEAASSWVESQVTWNSRSTGTPWTTPGGDFLPAILASIDTSTLAGSAAFDGVNEQFTVNLLSGAGNAAARKTLIDSWTSGGSNEGLLMKASSEPTAFFVGFRDRSRIAAERPMLTIDYTPVPEPTSLSLLGCGVGVLALVRRRQVRMLASRIA